MNAYDELPRELALQVRVLQAVEPSEADLRAAQRKLDEVAGTRLRAARPVVFNKWALAASAASLCVFAFLFLPTVGQNVAFAEVQRHFQSFKTLSFVVDTSMNGESIQKSHVYMNEAGDVRTDVGSDVTVLVSAAAKEVLMLMHGPQTAMRFPIDVAPKKQEDPLAWLEEIRAYQSVARYLGSKVIDGRTVVGWELDIQGMKSQLWADESGLPLWLHVDQQGIQVQMNFVFNEPLAPSLFSTDVPNGYTEERAD